MEYYKNLSLIDITEEINGILFIEEWKDVIGYEGKYYVSSFGRIKSVIQKNRIKILKQSVCAGYLRVDLVKKDNHKLVHRLVAEAFIPNHKNKPQVNHKTGDKKKNIVSELEWSTSSEQQIHAQKVLGFKPNISGLLKKLDRAKTPVSQIDVGTGGIIRIFDSQKEACRFFNLDKDAIYRVLKGRQETVAGYKWEYVV